MTGICSSSRARVFGSLAESSPVPKPARYYPAAFDSTHFSVDSRNENLPNKRIHQNYVWIAVPVRPSGSLVDRPLASAFAPKADK
jgi:hypothetical protein